MVIDLERARRETPGCLKKIHFNNAGASLVPQVVLDAVVDHLRLEAEIGGYEAADKCGEAVADTYAAVADLIGCSAHEIALVENASRAWGMAFYGLKFKPGDRILTGRAEYSSNYIAFLQVARRTGALIEVIPCDESGQTSPSSLAEMIDDRVKLVALTHVPTNGGLVNPAAEVGRITRAAGVPFLLDACQSVGQMPVLVEETGCDMLSVTGRKYLRAPRGTGFLYVREGFFDQLEPPLLDNHAASWTAKDQYELRKDARRFETWEGNVAAKIGLGRAVRYASEWGLSNIQERVVALADQLRSGLRAIKGMRVHDLGHSPCGIVSFTMENRTPSEIKSALSAENINISVSEAVATLLDMENRGLSAVARASVHYYNHEDEMTRVLAVLDRFRAG